MAKSRKTDEMIKSPSDLRREKALGLAKKGAGSHKDIPEPKHPGVRKRDNSGAANGTGPEFEIDHEQLYEAALTQASYDQLAIIFGVTSHFLLNHYKDLIDQARSEKLLQLRSVMFHTAIEGKSPVMQIWLSKQHLGMSDKSTVTQQGPNGGPVQTEVTKKVVAYIPDNGRGRKKASSNESET